jgi:hypothetical protein
LGQSRLLRARLLTEGDALAINGVNERTHAHDGTRKPASF